MSQSGEPTSPPPLRAKEMSSWTAPIGTTPLGFDPISSISNTDVIGTSFTGWGSGMDPVPNFFEEMNPTTSPTHNQQLQQQQHPTTRSPENASWSRLMLSEPGKEARPGASISPFRTEGTCADYYVYCSVTLIVLKVSPSYNSSSRSVFSAFLHVLVSFQTSRPAGHVFFPRNP